MGKVTKFIVNFVREKIEEYGIVVWYDPDLIYNKLLSEISVDDIHVFKYNGSFLELRHEIEPYMRNLFDSKVLIYMPIERVKGNSPLIEAETTGITIEPGGAIGRNTRLAVLAKEVLKQIITPDYLTEIYKNIDSGKLSLEDLDKLAEEGMVGFGTVKLIFGTSDIAEVTLAFVASNEDDNEIEKRKAVSELLSLLKFGIGFKSSSANIVNIRDELARYLLLSDFVYRMGDKEKLTSLESVPKAYEKTHIENVAKITSTWRNRFDFQQAYLEASEKVEKELDIESLTLDPEDLIDSETLPFTDRILQTDVQKNILDLRIKDAKAVIERRKNTFWALAKPENGLKWNFLNSVNDLLQKLAQVRVELNSIKWIGADFVKAYCQESGWHILDYLHRRVEKQYLEFDEGLEDEESLLEQIVALTRNSYAEVADKLTDKFLKIIEKEGLNIKGIENQNKIFYRFVEPFLGKEKIAYFLIDALRYEMGAELTRGIEAREASINYALACIPTVTDIGMAALVPKANESMRLFATEKNKLDVQINEKPLRNREDRISLVRNIYKDSFFALRLENILKLTKSNREKVKGKDLVIVTSREIDDLGEKDNVFLARKIMGDVLADIKRGVRNLHNLGFTRFVITSDHGYIFGEEIKDDMKIDSPGGQVIDLSRRYWAGRGGVDSDSSVRIKASVLGWSGDFDFIFPRGLSCFKAAGSTHGYFHGGISLQEVVIPIIELKFEEREVKEGLPAIFEMNLPKKIVTTRFFTASIKYYPSGLFVDETYKVRLSIREGKNEVGAIATAVYGFEESTGEITLEKEEENHLTIMLTKEVEKGNVISLHLLDAKTGKELKAIKNIEVSISI